ncbi:hypothetical protein KKF82_07670 [Patescibacteria group bacterium]|uniref:Uncharacterized protein n=1 Tax=viral metagenome TaxID=1070528 RepID=A0A6M3M4W0_9ZZZZ|nr:hypothetical protein [Patescibacteria group bacterium]
MLRYKLYENKEAKAKVNSEKLSDRVTNVTRSILERSLNNPMFLLTMAAHEISPEDIKLKVKYILNYLDETMPFEEKKEDEA